MNEAIASSDAYRADSQEAPSFGGGRSKVDIKKKKETIGVEKSFLHFRQIQPKFLFQIILAQLQLGAVLQVY